jgi:peroxiredoxin
MQSKGSFKIVHAVYLIGALALSLVSASCSGTAESASKALAIGAVAPDFALKDFEAKDHTLSALKGKIVVLDFSSIECPYSRGVDKDGLVELARAYTAKGVVFLGVDSHKSTTPEQIKQYAAENKIPFPILKDAANKYADAVGATRTPEFFILDKDLKLAYHGAFDDRKDPEKRGATGHVRNALDDLLAGRPVKTPEVAAWGCTIKRVE